MLLAVVVIVMLVLIIGAVVIVGGGFLGEDTPESVNNHHDHFLSRFIDWMN